MIPLPNTTAKHPSRAERLVFACLSGLALSLVAAFAAGPHGWGLLDLVGGWRRPFQRDTATWGWLLIRAAYLLALWCGLRAVVLCPSPRPVAVRLAGLLSAALAAAGVAGCLLLPGIAK